MPENPEKTSAATVTLDGQALRYLETNGPTSVQQLFDVLVSMYPTLTPAEASELFWRLAGQGKIELEDGPVIAGSLLQFLSHWGRNLPFYGSLIISLSTILVIYATPPFFPFLALRWILGCGLLLFIPGYAMVEALFPRGRLSSVEGYAVSITLSLALDSLLALSLNFTPWGIRLASLLISLTILSVGLAFIAAARKYRAIAKT